MCIIILWQFLYMKCIGWVLDSSWIKLFPCLFTTVYGLGSKRVVSLFFLSCCTSTWSPGSTSEYLAFLFTSAYALLLLFRSLSLWRTSCSTCTTLSSGSYVFSVRRAIRRGLRQSSSEVGFCTLQDKHSVLPSSPYFQHVRFGAFSEVSYFGAQLLHLPGVILLLLCNVWFPTASCTL